MQFIWKLLQVVRDEQDTLGLEGSADARNRGRQMFFQELRRLCGGDTFFERTFEDVRQHQAELLKFGKRIFWRLPFRGDLDGLKNGSGLSLEANAGSIEKISVGFRGDAAKEQRLDVNGAKAGGPREALETTRNVRRVGRLAAAVAGEKNGVRHNYRES